MTLPRIGYAALGAALIIAAAFTQPFTRGAEVTTAIAILVGVSVLIHTLRSPTSLPVLPAIQRGGIVWIFLFCSIVGWELYSYFSSPRSTHPTLSVLIDMGTSTPIGRGVTFLLWLILGFVVIADD